MDDCNDKYDCKNYPDKCFRCNGEKLFSSKSGKKRSAFVKPHDMAVATSDDSWKDLEQQVADALNSVPSIRDARRSRASGALWFEKGDIVDKILHPECKERAAEKSFSVKKEWLEKAAKECQYENKEMCLPFRFKGDDQIYVIMRNQDLMELVTMMKAYINDNEKLQKKVDILKEKIRGE